MERKRKVEFDDKVLVTLPLTTVVPMNFKAKKGQIQVIKKHVGDPHCKGNVRDLKSSPRSKNSHGEANTPLIDALFTVCTARESCSSISLPSFLFTSTHPTWTFARSRRSVDGRWWRYLFFLALLFVLFLLLNTFHFQLGSTMFNFFCRGKAMEDVVKKEVYEYQCVLKALDPKIKNLELKVTALASYKSSPMFFNNTISQCSSR